MILLLAQNASLKGDQMSANTLSEEDWQVRLFVYNFFVEQGRLPSTQETATHFKLSLTEAEAHYLRLNAAHAFFLNPGTFEVRMAHPLSAIPTDFLVRIDGKQLWANCAWDSVGIPAMLGLDADIEASNSLTGEQIHYAIRNGILQADADLVVHFPLPFTAWYDDLVYT
jgi:hypothetical protein